MIDDPIFSLHPLHIRKHGQVLTKSEHFWSR